MSQKPDNADLPTTSPRAERSWTGAAVIAGAAIGSAALTAALLYATRRKDKPARPPHPEQAPETD